MIRLIKREEISKAVRIRTLVVAVILALIVAGVFIAAIGFNPIKIYDSMIKGSFGSPYRIRQTIIRAIPLVVAAIGISVAFKMQFWNIGGEGQILMGALGAALVALNLSTMSKPLLLIIMALAAIVFGALWSLIAGFLKVYFNTNETIVTLMLNYIALKFITYLQYGPMRDKKAMNFPKIANFSDNAILPNLFKVHIGWIIALVIVICFYMILKHSKLGYEISVLGESQNTARYAGININMTVLKAIAISGALCGLTGFIQASAVSQTLSTEITGGAGFTAIIVAWLSNLNAIAILIVSILFAALLEGGSYIQTSFGIPNAAASVIQALILFFVLGSDLFIRYKVNIRPANNSQVIFKNNFAIKKCITNKPF